MAGKVSANVSSSGYHGGFVIADSIKSVSQDNPTKLSPKEKDETIQRLMKHILKREVTIRSFVPNDACELSEHSAYRMCYADYFPEQSRAKSFVSEVEKACGIYIQVLGPTLEDFGMAFKKLSSATEKSEIEFYTNAKNRLTKFAFLDNPDILLEQIKERLNVESVYFRYAKTDKVTSLVEADLYTYLETKICRVLNKRLTWEKGYYKRFGQSFRLECREGASFHLLVKDKPMLSLMDEVVTSCVRMGVKMSEGQKFSKRVLQLQTEIKKKSQVPVVVPVSIKLTFSKASAGVSSTPIMSKHKAPVAAAAVEEKISSDDPWSLEQDIVESKMASREKAKEKKRERSPQEMSPKAVEATTIKKNKKKHKKSKGKKAGGASLQMEKN